ncbi:MAG: glycosyltransferase [Firmicutes bacterium]|nr:glycosyltransferase [Bacillota bacterium]
MKISVIIPVYNCEKYIDRCIKSVLSQNGAQLDVIVINDGSTDNTGRILEKYKDDVRIVTTDNRGSSAARNKGLEIFEGDYIMFLDSDDYLFESAVKTLVDTIEKTDADIVKFRYQRVFPDGKIKIDDNQFKRYEVIEKKDFPEKLYRYFIDGIRMNSVCIGIYRSSLIKGRRFRSDMPVAEDAVFSLKTYTNAKRVVTIPDILYNYYNTGKGLTGTSISVAEKFKCNNIFASKLITYLKVWGMDTPFARIRVRLRVVFLTFDKIKRILQKII